MLVEGLLGLHYFGEHSWLSAMTSISLKVPIIWYKEQRSKLTSLTISSTRTFLKNTKYMLQWETSETFFVKKISYEFSILKEEQDVLYSRNHCARCFSSFCLMVAYDKQMHMNNNNKRSTTWSCDYLIQLQPQEQKRYLFIFWNITHWKSNGEPIWLLKRFP